ncbi:hypothetical protein U1737_07690 [Sphingomonas sp. LB3N6]|uniref:hypothetical protein n=1 Tax=Sphingomonas fucosidasi TaxID=3096164 RepID=UPI002FC78968
MKDLLYIPEPRCLFGFNQSMEHPKDGLTAFGPVSDRRQPKQLRIGAIGTRAGLAHLNTWVSGIQMPVAVSVPGDPKESTFPGFQVTFRCEWPTEPVASIEIDAGTITDVLRHADPHQRIYNAVSIYRDRIAQYVNEEEFPVDFWFVIVPEELFERGRPLSQVPMAERTNQAQRLKHSDAKSMAASPLFSFLDDVNEAAQKHRYARNFHDQLKGRLLEVRAVVQVVRETTLNPKAFVRPDGRPGRRLQGPADIAWNLSTAAFYKAGGQPWRIEGIRPGVCYLGMVYKRLDESSGNQACCGAQMFLSDGDGLVFKGAVGNWYSDRTGEYHLDRCNAELLMKKAIGAYTSQHGGPPSEVFIHGKARFTDAEWQGFLDGVPDTTKLVGVRIRRSGQHKLYRSDRFTALRGLARRLSHTQGLLWTIGFVPRLQTYQGREVPSPLLIDICRGEADLQLVMSDVLALTKVNFNTCIYGDGIPVTLRFADRVGAVLTAIPPEINPPPLPFRHYI